MVLLVGSIGFFCSAAPMEHFSSEGGSKGEGLVWNSRVDGWPAGDPDLSENVTLTSCDADDRTGGCCRCNDGATTVDTPGLVLHPVRISSLGTLVSPWQVGETLALDTLLGSFGARD